MQVRRLTSFDISPSIQSEIDILTGNSFFASYDFIRLWKYMSGTAVHWIVEENDNIVAVLPSVEFGISKLKRIQALPDGCYSSIYTNNNIDSEKYKEELLQAIASSGYVKIFIYDFYNSVSNAEGYDVLKCQTTLIDVSSPNWQPPDKKLQSEIRKAERENVIVEKFHYEKHFDKFISLMHQTEKRHNRKPKYSDIFFKTFAELAENDERIIWNWCEHDGHAVSSHINFIEQNQIINWQVYFNKKFSSLKANQKMLFDLAQTARFHNKRYLNLGASPIETPTLIEYKNKWGGEIKEYVCYVHKTMLGKIF